MDAVEHSSERDVKPFMQQAANSHKKIALEPLTLMDQIANNALKLSNSANNNLNLIASNNNNIDNSNMNNEANSINSSSQVFCRNNSSSSSSSSPSHSANSILVNVDSIAANKGYTFEEQFKQLYELSDDPKRKEFLDDLFQFMADRNQPVNRIPIMAKHVLDLYELYNLVVARGGLVEVINKKIWREITKGLDLPQSITSAAFTLRTQYMKYLYPYECAKNNFSQQDELQQAIDGNRREGRRSGQHSSHHYHFGGNAAASMAASLNASAVAGYCNERSACSSGSTSPAPQHHTDQQLSLAIAAATAAANQQQAGSHAQLAFNPQYHHILATMAASIAAGSQQNFSAPPSSQKASSNTNPNSSSNPNMNPSMKGSSLISNFATSGHPLNLAGSTQYQGK